MDSPNSFFSVDFIIQTLITTLLSGSIVGFFLKSLVDRRVEQHRFTRDWKEKSLSIVVGPVVMHLSRTFKIATRYKVTSKERTTSYFDASLMYESNEAVRSILLSNGHLIPESLRDHVHNLIAHYDVWLRRFDAKVALEKPEADSLFDVGFAEIPFPREAAEAFKEAYEALRKELYDVDRP